MSYEDYESLDRETLIGMLRQDDEQERGWAEASSAASAAADAEAAVAESVRAADLSERIKAARSPQELDALLYEQEHAGVLPGHEHAARDLGSGESLHEWDVRAARAESKVGLTFRERMEADADALTAKLKGAYGDRDAHELGLHRLHEAT